MAGPLQFSLFRAGAMRRQSKQINPLSDFPPRGELEIGAIPRGFTMIAGRESQVVVGGTSLQVARPPDLFPPAVCPQIGHFTQKSAQTGEILLVTVSEEAWPVFRGKVGA